ncbi:hypothetical protein [Phytohabitans aurantiacus]|uniref:Uncharacterized protein n=1 Tax=Phytohabitans aurantiacus TaxID=3016789 RepID=A0ABQ5QT01_9ACTN|nr:hypothetical protein [Phytohabitans aurantiacus]GLH97382.1 hypothetical protein Pa4123_26570 [Phytohabitans aurantiacus]
MPTTEITLALALTCGGILVAIAGMLRPEPLIVHRGGATIGWSPAADLAEVAAAAAERPADLDGDYSPHHLRMHLAAKHGLPEALDWDDEYAENVHRAEHQRPEVQARHSILELGWTPSAVDRARRSLDEADDRRVVAGGWRDLIQPPAVDDLAASIVEAHVATVHPGEPCTDVDGRCVAVTGPDLAVLTEAAAAVPPIVRGRYRGHHREDTVELHVVPDGWMPPVGARRLAAILGDTQAGA